MRLSRVRDSPDRLEPLEELVQALWFAHVLEGCLAELVNTAYGLTPEEVALLWRTAPPRMQ